MSAAKKKPAKVEAGELKRYRALVGIAYPGPKASDEERRYDVGDEFDDLPDKAIDRLLAKGYIEEVK